MIVDKLGREIHDLRISITDRCNFRCVYCMPKEKFGRGYKFLARNQLLSFEEIERTVRLFAKLGVRKIRITGGEPMLRADLPDLVSLIASIDGIDDLSMTTNASLLTPEKAKTLRNAGLGRLNVSLDSLNDADFVSINDVGFSVSRVLSGIDALDSAGFKNTKVNMVVRKGTNESSILPMARHFYGSGHILRFIEYMDVGTTNEWKISEVVTATEIKEMIHSEMPLESLQTNYMGEVARRWKYVDGGGEIGIISSVTQPFCGNCSRARLSAVGKLYTCLFASDGFDIRELLRQSMSEAELLEAFAKIWMARDDRYSETRGKVPNQQKVEMSHIGG